MSASEPIHTEQHLELTRRLVEQTLAGDEQREAERLLLACPDCLSEYNHYRAFWHSLAGEEYFERLESYLKANNTARHTLYAQTMDRLSADTPLRSGLGFSFKIWRPLAAAMVVAILLGVSTGVYKIIALQRALQTKDAYVRQLLAAGEKKDQSLRAGETQLAELRRRLAESVQSKPIETTVSSRPIPSTGLKPLANAILTVSFLTSRQADGPIEIAAPADKTFLNFQLRAPDEKDYKAYRLVISNAQGRVLWQAAPVGKDRFGNLSILLGKDFLAPGDYVLQIYGIDGGAREMVSQYFFRITP